MLIGIGLPMAEDSTALTLAYRDGINTDASQALLAKLGEHEAIKTQVRDKLPEDMAGAMADEGFDYFLDLNEQDDIKYVLYYRETDEQGLILIEGIENVLEAGLGAKRQAGFTSKLVTVPQESYIKILLPGLIGMTLLMIGLNGFGMVLVEERERGVFRKIKTIDARPYAFLGGLLFSRILVCYGVVVLMYLISYFVFGITDSVDYLLLFLVVTLGCAAFLALGLVLTVASKTQAAFNGMSNFIMIPLIVFSGVFFSVDKFPQWLQVISKMQPLTHFNIALQKIFFENTDLLSSISMIGPQLLVMGLWFCLLTLFAVRRFQW